MPDVMLDAFIWDPLCGNMMSVCREYDEAYDGSGALLALCLLIA
jgi:hypothetical protein